MIRPVRFRPEAKTDVNQALQWYGQERPRLRLAFAASLDAVIARIAEAHEQFPVVKSEIRRALLGRFPYGVFFVPTAERIEVLAVLHLHRDPKTWQARS